jgi:hypothetical protein
MLNRLARVTPAVLRRSLGSRHWQNRQRYTIPSLAVIGIIFFPATARRQKWREHGQSPSRSQVRIRSAPLAGTPPTRPSLRGLDRIETVVQDETGRTSRSRPTCVPSGNRDTAETAAYSCTWHPGGRTGKGTFALCQIRSVISSAQDVDEPGSHLVRSIGRSGISR